MKKLFLWTFVLTLLCTWAVVGADQAPNVPTANDTGPVMDREAVKAEKDRAAMEIIAGMPLTSSVAPAGRDALKLEKMKADIEPVEMLRIEKPDASFSYTTEQQEKAPYVGPENVPDQNIILQGGDRCEDATPVPAIPYTDNGTTAGYNDDYDEVCPYTGSTSPDVVYSYSPEVDIYVDITLCTGQTAYDTKLYVYEDVCQEPNDGQDPYDCNDDACSAPYNYDSELYCVPMFVGHTYYIVVDGYGGDSGPYTIDITECIPPTGACCVGLDCVATNTEAECTNMGGTWYEGQTCPDFQCPLMGDTECPPTSHFSQNVTPPDGGWTFANSEPDLGSAGPGYLCYENFLTNGWICDIHWWGGQLNNAGGWHDCGEDPVPYEITFYDDVAGMPDDANPVAIYNVVLTGQPTGWNYAGIFEAKEYETFLDPCLHWTLMDGWVSIGGGGDPECWFMWGSHGETGAGFAYQYYMDGTGFQPTDYDLSLCLTGEYEPITGACCNDQTGICDDDVDMTDCPPPLRFAANTLCVNLEPPCEEHPCADYSVNAPVVNEAGNTCGMGNDCGLRDTEEVIYAVTIPNDGNWTFSLCGSGYDTYLFVGTTCCGAEVGENDDYCGLQSQLSANITAGVYYVDIEGYSGCGAYLLNVWEEGECDVPCPAGAYLEQEPCGEDVNGGCNMEPPQYFEPITCQMDVCGTAWADGGTRDTDWFEIDFAVETEVTVTAEAEFPLQLLVIYIADCGNPIFEYAQVAPCVVAEVTVTAGPGLLWVWIGDQAYDGNPCGGDNDDYWFFVDCGGCPEYITVDIFTDEYPEETTWELIERAGGTVVASAGPLDMPLTQYSWDVCASSALCYDWVIYDLYGDGICCDWGPGHYEIYGFGGELLCSGGDFGFEEVCPDIGQCVPPTGACCVGDECLMTSEQQPCLDAGGVWYEGETCPEFQCPIAPCTGETVVYRNAGPYDDYGSPASQYAADYPFACGAADDVTPGEALIIDGVETWTTHWNGAEGLGPNAYAGINITFYYNYFHPVAGYDMPDGYLGDDGVRVAYDVGWVSTEFVPIALIAFEADHGCTGDRWHLMIPITPVNLAGGVKYWLEIQPVMTFAAPGGQSAVQIGDANTGDAAEQIFILLALDPWTPIDGNAGSCPDTEPAGTFRDLAFCLHGIAGGDPTGACCDEGVTGDCEDGLTLAECEQLQYARWEQDVACVDLEPPCEGAPPACVYIVGDCNHNGVALELADVIAMIAYYRGQQTPAYTCDCPPHGANFMPDADPNSNCTAFELADVVAQIAFYRGQQTPGAGCIDCLAPGIIGSGEEGTAVIPHLKSKVKIKRGSTD